MISSSLYPEIDVSKALSRAKLKPCGLKEEPSMLPLSRPIMGASKDRNLSETWDVFGVRLR